MKTKGLTNGNRKTILNKFNVNSEIALKNLKQEANAIVISRIQERKNYLNLKEFQIIPRISVRIFFLDAYFKRKFPRGNRKFL